MWRVTHRVHLPTVALGVLWIIHSVATTMYVPWQNNRQRAALKSLQAAVETTLQIQEDLFHLQSAEASQGLNEHQSTPSQELYDNTTKLQRQLNDLESRPLLEKLAAHVQMWQSN